MEGNGMDKLSSVLRMLGEMNPVEQERVLVYIQGMVDGRRLNEEEHKKAVVATEKEAD